MFSERYAAINYAHTLPLRRTTTTTFYWFKTWCVCCLASVVDALHCLTSIVHKPHKHTHTLAQALRINDTTTDITTHKYVYIYKQPRDDQNIRAFFAHSSSLHSIHEFTVVVSRGYEWSSNLQIIVIRLLLLIYSLGYYDKRFIVIYIYIREY